MEADSEYTDLLAGTYMVSYVYLAMTTLAVFDYISTLESEIEVVWKRPKWNMVQLLFFITRYAGVGVQIFTAIFNIHRLRTTTIDLKSCKFNTRLPIPSNSITGAIGQVASIISFVLGSLVLFCMQGIMMFRISSMYSHDKRVITILSVGLIVEIVSNITLNIFGSRAMSTGLQDMGTEEPSALMKLEMQICSGNEYPPWMFTLWIPVLFFELIIFYYALALGLKYHRGLGHMHSLTGHLPGSSRRPSLAYVLFRDSIMFPLFAALICVFELLCYIKLDRNVAHALFAVPPFLTTMLGSRLILNLREVYYRPYEEELETIDADENNEHPLVFLTDPSNPRLGGTGTVIYSSTNVTKGYEH